MPEPEMQMVDSSNIEAVGYDAENAEIYVRFLSGSTYVYTGAEQAVFEGLLHADSIGSYFNREIKNTYDCNQL